MLPLIIGLILDMLPALITAAIELFTGIVTGLVEILPELIQTISDMGPNVEKQLLAQLPSLTEKSVTLFLGIQEGLVKAMPEILAALVPLVPDMVMGLARMIPLLEKAGVELLGGLIKGILDNAPRLIAGVIKNIGDGLVNGLKAFFGIKSPSRVFANIGQSLTQGLALGLNDGKGSVMDAAQGLADAVDANFGTGGFNANISTTIPATIASRAMGVSAGNYDAAIKPFGSMGMDNAAGSTINYYAAPNASISAEEKLVTAIQRARVLGWNH
jgi:phage-related protein